MKVILNNCYGGFGVSKAAYIRYAQLKGIDLHQYERVNDYGEKLKYKKVSLNKELDSLESNFTIEDLGESPKKITDKQSLYLDEDHRTDPVLIQVVEELGEDANGSFSDLEVVDIPDDMKWYISDYDGIETLHEEHRSW